MKTSSVIVAVVGVLLVGITYQNFDVRMDRMEERLQATETALQPLEPLRRIMASAQSRPMVGQPYQAVQATGPRDVENEGRDSARAWCPAMENAGPEWLLLTYPKPVETAAVRVVASYHPGAVTRLVAIDENGTETELWAGEASGERARHVSDLPVTPPTRVSQLKIILDTLAVDGWNEIDAVALLDSDGREHWAQEATASSYWSSAPRGDQGTSEAPPNDPAP